ncbi:MAG: hypothetical protein MK179_22680, partial [Pirellulaceae bacterium]|nr:hypothetical protein [Pirellulaceae bacterium]
DLNADGSRGDGDNQINMTQELAFTEWLPTGEVTDLQALAMFDTLAELGGNGDGVLSAADTVWSELRVWHDANSNGVADAGELQTLADLGFSQINLTYDDGTTYDDNSNDVSIFGSTLLGTASFTRNGEVSVGGVGDVSLRYNGQGYTVSETSTEVRYDFENGEVQTYLQITSLASANYTISSGGYDGAIGDARNNSITAEGLNTSVLISGGDGNDIITGGASGDLVSGEDGNDFLKGADGDDIIYGGIGHDSIVAGNGDDTIFGGDGNDHISAHNGNDEVYGGSGNDNIGGGNDVDTIWGDGGNDTIGSGGGDDFISGGADQDYLSAGAGHDILLGDEGNDTLVGGSGNDSLWGGSGADNFVFKALVNGETDRILDFDSSVDQLDFRGTRINSISDFDQYYNTVLNGKNCIVIKEGGHKILLEDMTISQLSVEDFIFA